MFLGHLGDLFVFTGRGAGIGVAMGPVLQRSSHRLSSELGACLAHGSDGLVVGFVEAHTNVLLAQRFLALRDAVLMLSQVFCRSHALTRLHATQATGGVMNHQR